MENYIEAHKYSSKNKKDLLKDTECGCFFCLEIFSPDKIEEWCCVNDDDNTTAICPYCEVDSVIGKNSGFPITKEFLTQMKKYWFRGI